MIEHKLFSKLYPRHLPQLGRHGYLEASDGSSRSVQLSGFVDEVVGSAWNWARLRQENPTYDDVAAEIPKILDTIRKAMGPTGVSIPIRIGLTGVLLPDGTDELDLGCGKVRRATCRDYPEAVMEWADRTAAFTAENGELFHARYAGDLVLEIDLPYKLTPLENESPGPPDLKNLRVVERVWDGVTLALLFAVEQSHIQLLQTWSITYHPLQQHLSYSYLPPERVAMPVPRRLSMNEAVAWQNWARLIHKNRGKYIDIAIRRVVRAASERNEPEDMLIDAVVAWENLFGGKGESTLRVTYAMAWLLAVDLKERETFQSEMGRIYSMRSDMVHGAKRFTTWDQQQMSTRATEFAINALQKLLEVRPDLLAVRDSAARGKTLILGG
ncbi:hypothetical protein ACFQV2_12810 [Actinokineospora soli]|uniref:Apea-like HEPN domain-containing protein n=1 Tax=Actinokineospora soli TaxID=1048753 RepID=A0ABW2TLJ6_9PSEU